MKWLNDLWNRIVSSNDQQYIDRINELEQKLDTEIDNYNFMKEQFELMQKTKNQLMEQLDQEILRCNKLTNQYKIDQPKPNLDIDFTKRPYTGRNANIFYNSNTKKLETNYSLITISKYYRFWNDEFYTGVMNAYKRDKPKLDNIREFMLFARNILFNDFGFVYHHDLTHEGVLTENWKTISQIWADKNIDCEDFSICIVAICNILGIPSDRVFMITGYYGNGGHAYPGFIDSDGKVKILEATNNAYPITTMKGSFYTSKGTIAGISNWAWAGVPRVEQL